MSLDGPLGVDQVPVLQMHDDVLPLGKTYSLPKVQAACEYKPQQNKFWASVCATWQASGYPALLPAAAAEDYISPVGPQLHLPTLCGYPPAFQMVLDTCV